MQLRRYLERRDPRVTSGFLLLIFIPGGLFPNTAVTGYQIELQAGLVPGPPLRQVALPPRVPNAERVIHFVQRLGSAVSHRVQRVLGRFRGQVDPLPVPPDNVVEERLGEVVDALRVNPPRNFWHNQLPDREEVMAQLGLVPGDHPVVQLGLRYVCFDALMRAGRVYAMARVLDQMGPSK